MTVVTGAIPTWTLADRLRKARLHAGLEQDQLADEIGIARQSVSNYERGQTAPNRPVIWAWADVTGIDRAWLLGDGDERQLPRLDSNQQPAGDVNDDLFAAYHGRGLNAHEQILALRRAVPLEIAAS